MSKADVTEIAFHDWNVLVWLTAENSDVIKRASQTAAVLEKLQGRHPIPG